MPLRRNPNLELLEDAVEQLGALVGEVVILGGCATGLLITDPAAPPLRITRDLDVMVEVATLSIFLIGPGLYLRDRIKKINYSQFKSRK